jgi:hypothetical protein
LNGNSPRPLGGAFLCATTASCSGFRQRGDAQRRRLLALGHSGAVRRRCSARWCQTHVVASRVICRPAALARLDLFLQLAAASDGARGGTLCPPDAVCDPVLMSNGSGGVGAQMPSKYRLTKLAALLALCGLSIFLGRCSSTDHGDHKERCSTVAGGVARVLVGVSGTRRHWCCVG